MIRVDLDEQTAVDVHHALGVIRGVFDHRTAEGDLDLTAASTACRDAQLAIAGGLRAVGWTPSDDGWTKRPTRRRR